MPFRRECTTKDPIDAAIRGQLMARQCEEGPHTPYDINSDGCIGAGQSGEEGRHGQALTSMMK